ncbi:hypothetical protein EG19_06815 [Thermoanaerobaculum aquaticum]|uniref:Uncharacterized protein n=1 Tax=Thermoanaerobaculum aquaticum TaxID=1312852 RepID=A0A062XKW2_9BACT|nr:hypothetical protein [Thermoanaerobaculum aquaticum]KDA53192.1 hypothetical protein EG19_06815 [Thermoanaerobaculum aquaticum]
MAPRVLLIVTRVAGLDVDKDLLRTWGVDPENTGPWYFDERGTGSTDLPKDGLAVVILRGDSQINAGVDVGTRIKNAVKDTGVDDICLFVHPGGAAMSAAEFVGSQWPESDPWRRVCARDFSTVGDGAAVRNSLIELGTYANGRNQHSFRQLLNVILAACQNNPMDKSLQAVLGDPEQRKKRGLPRKAPTAAPADPIATIIHDVVSGFDAVLLDLQTAQENPESWTEEVKNEARKNIETALARLRFLAGGGVNPTEDVRAWAERRGWPQEGSPLLSSEEAKTSIQSSLQGVEGIRAKLYGSAAANWPKERFASVHSELKGWVDELVSSLERSRRGKREQTQG